MGRERLVGKMTEQSGVRLPEGIRIYFSSPKTPTWRLIKCVQRVKWPRREADHPVHLVPKLRTSRAIRLLPPPPMLLCGGAEGQFTCNLLRAFL
jgi:hypothetical protein